MILSANYSLVDLDEEILCYDMRLGHRYAITAQGLREQAEQLGLRDTAEVVVLAPAAYADLAVQVFHVRSPCCSWSCCHRGAGVVDQWRLFWVGDGGSPQAGHARAPPPPRCDRPTPVTVGNDVWPDSIRL